MPNEITSTLEDYAHWNEDAAYIKAQEDRWVDYYDEPYDDDYEPYD